MIAVVTEASSGIGLGIATELIETGWKVIGIARGALGLKRAKRKQGDNFSWVTLDITKYGLVKIAFTKIFDASGKIDLLVNNAGVFTNEPFGSIDPGEARRIVDVNLLGTIYCTQSAMKFMEKPSRIINICSVAGLHGIEGQAVYCASKFGVSGFGEAIGPELARKDILLTTVYPGGVDTPLWNGKVRPTEKSRLLRVLDVAEVVSNVVNLDPSVVMKRIEMFPDSEWF